MIIFGSIGIFVKNISWNSSVIALVRAAVGTLVLLLVSLGSEISIRRKEQRL